MAADGNDLRGAKGGDSKPRPATEAADSLVSIAYARVVDLVSEGPIRGFAHGPTGYMQDIYLDETPIGNPDGSFNFTNIQVDSRSGTQDQDYLPGFPAVESEVAVGLELRSGSPYTRTLTNTQLSAERIHLSVPSLQKSSQSTGDITGYTIAYKIEVQTDGGAYATVLMSAFSGKASGKYEKTHRIDLPPATTGWSIRVTRITPNANSALIADTTTIDSVTDIIDGKFRYPNSALIGQVIDSKQFSSVPSRAFDLYGLIMQVPSNYDPDTRIYTGVWDGTFKPAWTNNPAWVYYLFATNDRFALGKSIGAASIDKFKLYQIGQYCDQLVDDGKGGQEPRFTCNLYLQAQADAYKVMQDLATIFRGISYWGLGSINAVADMPTDPVYTYTQGNVLDGLFTYSGSAKQTRYTVALVSWNDPADFYRAKVAYVPDDEGISRYGIISTPLIAVGCTSEAQAIRMGKWALVTSRLETETVNFQLGIEGVFAAPGQIIRVADNNRAGRRVGGRVRLATSTTITVDQTPVVEAGDNLTINMPSGVSQTRIVSGVSGNTITVTLPYTVAPNAHAVWVVESTELTAPTYKVLSVVRADDLAFTVTALRHVAQKFDFIDNGTKIELPPITVIPPSVQAIPENVTITGRTVLLQGIQTNVMNIAWERSAQAVSYRIEWKKDDGDWILAGQTSSLNIDVQGIYTGQYLARVRAINASDIASLPGYSELTDVVGKTGSPPALTFLTPTSKIFGIHLAWGFPAGAEDTSRTEIWRSLSNDRTTATKISDVAYPQATLEQDGLSAGASFFYWGRLVDKTGNIGPWYPTDTTGVNGQASSDESEYEAYFNQIINESMLGIALQTKINSITDVAGDLADVAAALGAVEGEVDTISGVISVFNPPMAGSTGDYAGATTVYAGVYSEQSARADADNAVAKRVDVVAAAMEGFDAAIETETTARIDADGALATQVTTVQATAGAAQALAQTASTAAATVDGKVSAAYTIKVAVDTNGNYYSAGMGISIDNSTGPVQSQVLFIADRLAIGTSINGSFSSAFVVQGGQVFLNAAFIGNAWITNAMIGDTIQSTNFVSGSTGWRLTKSTNTLELYGTVAGQGHMVISPTSVTVYDASNVMRVQMGMW